MSWENKEHEILKIIFYYQLKLKTVAVEKPSVEMKSSINNYLIYNNKRNDIITNTISFHFC